MPLVPIALLIIIDLFLISGVVLLKLRARLRSARAAHEYEKLDHAKTPLQDDSEYYGYEEGSIAMEDRRPSTRALGRRRSPTGFEQLAAMDSEFFRVDEHITPGSHKEHIPEENTDLRMFVQSLAKCLGGGRFGLNFDFENLTFQPKKAPKPILSQVSGCINEGSLWGVMGASGAGKSTFVNVLMGKTDHTGGVTKVNGVPGDIKK